MSSEELLREAVIRFHETELESLPSNTYLAIRQEVSLGFLRGMQEMIHVNRRHGELRKIARRVAGFFFGILASLILLCSINEDLRASCLQFLRSAIEGMIEYQSVPETETTPSGENIVGFKLGYVPDGFELESYDSSNGIISYKSEAQEIFLDFSYNKDSTRIMRINGEHSSVKKINLPDGSEAEFYSNIDQDSTCLLIFKKYQYICCLSLTYSRNIDIENELIQIAKNIKSVSRD